VGSFYSRRSFSTLPLTEPLPFIPKQRELPLSPPQITTSKLDNGIKLVSVTNNTQPTTSIGIFLEGGSRLEDPHTMGTSWLMKHLGYQKTATRSSLRLIRDFEALGATYGVFVEREHISFCADVQSDKVNEILPLLADVLHPQFEDHILKETKEVARSTSEAHTNNPKVQVLEQLHAEAFRNKGLGNPLYPPVRSIDHLKQDTLENYVNHNYKQVENMVLVCVGNVSHDQLVQMASGPLKNLSRKSSAIKKTPSTYIGGDARLLDDPSATHIAIAFPGAGWNSKDVVSLGVLQFLLGSENIGKHHMRNGLASRFHKNIVEPSEGDVHQLFAFNFNYSDVGLFGVYGKTSPGKVTRLVESITKEMSLVCKSIEASELARAKAQFKANLLFDNQTKPNLLKFVATHALHTAKPQIPDDYLPLVDQINPDDIHHLANRLFKNKPTLVASGYVAAVPTTDQILMSIQRS